MSTGGGGSQTTTNKPWEGASGSMSDILDQIMGNLGTNRPGMTEGQLGGLGNLEDYYTNVMPGLVEGALGSWQNAMRDPTEVAQSQEVKDMIAANTAGIMTGLKEETLPEIRTGASGAGQYGGSRQGVAEGVATGKAATAATDAAADVTGQVYQDALRSQLGALGMTGGILGAGAAPGEGLLGVGEYEQGQNIADQDYLWNKLLQAAGIATGMGGTGGTSVTTNSSNKNPWATIAGLGSLGLGGFGMGSQMGWW